MALTRQAATFAKGWSQALVEMPRKKAAEVLLERVQPYATQLVRRAPTRGPPARARDDHAVRPRQAARRRCSASTTWSPRATASRRRHVRRHDRRQLRVGPTGKLARCATGRPSTASTWRRATSTPTASTTRRCCPRSATRWRSTPIPGCRSWRRSDGGRSSTSTCPKVSRRSSASSRSRWRRPSTGPS